MAGEQQALKLRTYMDFLTTPTKNDERTSRGYPKSLVRESRKIQIVPIETAIPIDTCANCVKSIPHDATAGTRKYSYLCTSCSYAREQCDFCKHPKSGKTSGAHHGSESRRSNYHYAK